MDGGGCKPVASGVSPDIEGGVSLSGSSGNVVPPGGTPGFLAGEDACRYST